MKNVLILFFIFSASIYDINAQVIHQNRHSLGVSLGMSHAFGMSYQYLGERTGIHTSLTPFVDLNDEYSFVAFSIGPMLHLLDSPQARYFLYESNGFVVNHYANKSDIVFMPAIGAGSKIWLNDNLTFDVALGIGILFGNEESGFPDYIMLPDVNLGFYYSF